MKKKVIKEEFGPETMTLEDECKKVDEAISKNGIDVNTLVQKIRRMNYGYPVKFHNDETGRDIAVMDVQEENGAVVMYPYDVATGLRPGWENEGEKDVNEEIDIDIETSHINDKTYATYETPGGAVDITLEGDPDTIDELLRIIQLGLQEHDQRLGSSQDYSSFYTKLHEDEMLGTETKFAPNTVGAMIGLLQKKGEMTGSLTTRLVDSLENIMPVGITAENGNVTLDFARGTPAVEVPVEKAEVEVDPDEAIPPAVDPIGDTLAANDVEI